MGKLRFLLYCSSFFAMTEMLTSYECFPGCGRAARGFRLCVGSKILLHFALGHRCSYVQTVLFISCQLSLQSQWDAICRSFHFRGIQIHQLPTSATLRHYQTAEPLLNIARSCSFSSSLDHGVHLYSTILSPSWIRIIACDVASVVPRKRAQCDDPERVCRECRPCKHLESEVVRSEAIQEASTAFKHTSST